MPGVKFPGKMSGKSLLPYVVRRLRGGVRFADYVGLLRHNTSKSGDVQISLREDVDRMMEGQNDI